MPMMFNGLPKLLEELGELSQVAAIAIAHNGDIDREPVGRTDFGDIRGNLEDEIADVLATIEFVRSKYHLDPFAIERRKANKLVKFRTWDLQA